MLIIPDSTVKRMRSQANNLQTNFFSMPSKWLMSLVFNSNQGRFLGTEILQKFEQVGINFGQILFEFVRNCPNLPEFLETGPDSNASIIPRQCLRKPQSQVRTSGDGGRSLLFFPVLFLFCLFLFQTNSKASRSQSCNLVQFLHGNVVKFIVCYHITHTQCSLSLSLPSHLNRHLN